jgi:hypothetical protein
MLFKKYAQIVNKMGIKEVKECMQILSTSKSHTYD